MEENHAIQLLRRDLENLEEEIAILDIRNEELRDTLEANEGARSEKFEVRNDIVNALTMLETIEEN